MILEMFTGRHINTLNCCEFCKFNVGYQVKDPKMIWCDKYMKYVRNVKKDLKCNTFKYPEDDANE